jgi:hypothetical protein
VRSGRRREALWHFAQASLRGQAAPVAADLAGLLHARLAGPTSSRSGTPEQDDWAMEADAWLSSLRG